MKKNTPSLSRREFLRLAGASLGAAFVPWRYFPDDGDPPPAPPPPDAWPQLSAGDLPPAARLVLGLLPRVTVDAKGIVQLWDRSGRPLGAVPLARTQWNQEATARWFRLYSGVPWAIVLHWFGDGPGFSQTLAGYLNGFNGVRPVDWDGFDLKAARTALGKANRVKLPRIEGQPGMEQIYAWQDDEDPLVYRTSAHFLVGQKIPQPHGLAADDGIGIVQTQAPDADGTPLAAAHLGALNVDEYKQRDQYYVLAYDQLSRSAPQNHSLLQDMYARPRLLPNSRTIGIEICGRDFDNPATPPAPQKIANVLALVWALMDRYAIGANAILGHHELNLGKGDPGKKFMALIRHLLGAWALVDGSPRMRELVFGPFLRACDDPLQAIQGYFNLNWSYLALVATQRRVYEWEGASQYWLLLDRLGTPRAPVATAYCPPFAESVWTPERAFLSPHNHEGVDLYLPRAAGRSQASEAPLRLLADGVCLFAGRTRTCAEGQTLMFRHRQSDGAELVSIYNHLQADAGIQVGQLYRVGQPVGRIENHPGRPDGFLHLALAYGATWTTDLAVRPDLAENASLTWIEQRYMPPVDYLLARI